MKTQQVVLTKELASEWLSKNDKNRNIDKQRVAAYTRQMNEGLWLEVGDTIRFEGDYERLLDGQHRLSAFLKSNLTALTVNVITFLSEESFKAMDIGVKRSTANIMQINGIPDASTLSAIVYAIFSVRNGLTSFLNDGRLNSNQASTKATASEVIDFIDKTPSIYNAASKARACYHSFRGLSKAEYGAFYFLFAEKDQELADDFFEQLSSGLNLTDTSPIYHLRKKLEQNKMSGVKMVGKMRQALVITCWNAYRKGAEMKHLRFNYESEMPKII